MAAPILELPPDCGARALPALIDSVAKTNGNRTIVSVPRTANLSDGYTDISFSAFADAVNRCCWWLDANVKRNDASKTLFYIGPLDIRYLIVMVATSKTGRTAFFSSHRNSIDAHLSLLESIRCQVALIPEKAPAVTKQILAARPMLAIDFPSLETFLNSSEPVEEYPYSPDFLAIKDNPFIILHTSGSTGIPKPVYVTHGTFASNDAHQLIPSLGGRATFIDYNRGNRFLICLPLFHAACLGMWAIGVYSGFTPVIPPSEPLSADVANLIILHGQIQGSLMPPSLIIDLFNNPIYLENMLEHLDFLCYIGGSLAAEVGDYISKYLKLITLFGTTENMYYPLEIHDRPVDWPYLRMSPLLGSIYRQEQEGQGTGELVVVRDPTKSMIQGVFSTFTKITEYPTSDLYERHPTRPYLWKFTGRSDDIICFNNAEKLNPITMESIIATHPDITSVVIGGHGEFQASLLIEPKKHPATASDAQELIEAIWPTVVRANRSCPAHGRIVKELIFLSDPARPLPKAGKTTVQRAGALKMYQQDFKDLYNRKKKQQTQTNPPTPAPVQKQATAAKLSEYAAIPDIRIDNEVGRSTGPTAVPLGIDLQLQDSLQHMIRDMLPDVFGSIVTQMTRNMLQTATLPPPKIPQSLFKGIDATSSASPLLAAENLSMAETEVDCQPVTDNTPQPDIKGEIQRVLLKTTYLPPDVADDANLFEYGLDSIQISTFLDELNGLMALRTAASLPPPLVKFETVYKNPTISQLASLLESS